MSNAAVPGPAAALKSALESAFIALLVGGVCLWFLISDTAGAEDVDSARATMFSIGLFAACCAHWVYMGLALKRAGRGVFWWMVAMVLLVPFASVVLGILLYNQAQEIEQQALQAQGQDGAGRAA
ncbi:hypothetical protein CDN99_05295 [Roseateles aquatilis]|uniref:Uncharacterized protein n=1 Tax=Roseateles aquatilis TaxID=431061 RepID=A0A246JNW5_9BURK|nr:hypothetical protein [Roseateles aquatilis]OWQ93849.1 hypothetical protein CDN99_05295 [Roseateles aquatilis]